MAEITVAFSGCGMWTICIDNVSVDVIHIQKCNNVKTTEGLQYKVAGVTVAL